MMASEKQPRLISIFILLSCQQVGGGGLITIANALLPFIVWKHFSHKSNQPTPILQNGLVLLLHIKYFCDSCLLDIKHLQLECICCIHVYIGLMPGQNVRPTMSF